MKWIALVAGALAAVAVLLVVLIRAQSSDPANHASAAELGREQATVVRSVEFEGACDASGAVAIDDRYFAVADDEDNVLRVYDAMTGGKAVRRTNLSKQIALEKKGEVDIEAATSLGERAFWLTSHGRNAKGDEDVNRSLVITTELPASDAKIEVQGKVYRNLLAELQASPEIARYELGKAALLAPKEPGGLNIEGLTATPEGTLLIGFRSPVPGGKALIVPLLNPEVLYDSGSPRFGSPIELDLGGLGVRSLSWWRGSYLIAAGSTAEGGAARLYRWKGAGAEPQLIADAALSGLNPEAFFTAEGNGQILVLSDDGGRDVGGRPCKKVKRKKRKSFRGVWLEVPDVAPKAR